MGFKFRVEFDDEGLPMVRPHRQFYGRSKTALAVELDFGEDEDVFAFIAKDEEELKGRSVRVDGAKGLVLTADPELYGPDSNRRSAGLMPLRRLSWGEWNLLGDL